nr:uncharacterized protein LOC126543419 [Dermacentor andersoni]
MAEYFKPEAETYLPLSTCTRDQVKAFLKAPYGKCLLNNESRDYPPLSEAIFRKPILSGVRYCRYLHSNSSHVEYLPYYTEENNIQKCILVCITKDADGEKLHNIHSAPDYLDCRTSRDKKKKVCISKICMDIPRKPPPLHSWLMNRATDNFQISDALYK